MAANPRQRRHRTPTGQDGSRRYLAMRKIRLVTAWAGAMGIALTGLFVSLASAASTHAASTTPTSSNQSPVSPNGAYGSTGITPTTSPYVSSPYNQGQGGYQNSYSYSPPPQVVTGAS
jgi:hypothetical protein